MKLLMLGTGNAMVTRCYNTCFALQDEGTEFFLVDAGGGNGILSQAGKAGLDFGHLHHMFVTHAHTDHVLGVIWVIRAVATLLNKGQYEGNLTIYCHEELVSLLNTFCTALFPPKLLRHLGSRILLKEVKNGDRFSALDMELTVFDICSTKAKQFGFQALLPDGQKLTCLGDESYAPVSHDYVENCDWLLTEAFCLYADRDTFKPYEKHHSTVADAAKMAQELRARHLVLYHTEDKTLATRRERYTAEATAFYHGPVFVPDDLEIIELAPVDWEV